MMSEPDRAAALSGWRGAREVVVRIDGRETAYRQAMVEVVETPDTALPRHRHHWEDETLYLLAGELEVWLADTRHFLVAGESIFLPRGVEHAVIARTARARLLLLLVPAGLEDFYRALGQGELETDLWDLVTIAARYGCEITGPPLARPRASPAPGAAPP